MSTSIETLDFNATSDMVPLNNNPVPPMPQTGKEAKTNTYDSQRENLEKNQAENNIDKEQMMELATPLDDIMDAPAQPQEQQMMLAPPQPTVMAPQAPMAQPAPQQAAPMKAQNPGGLSDDQMDALLAAAAAVVAFSPQVKDQIGKYAPQLFNEQGARTLAGTVATGLVAAGAFYGVKKFVLNK